jgi:hypothetical protein
MLLKTHHLRRTPRTHAHHLPRPSQGQKNCQRYREIAPLFSVANSKQELSALPVPITKVGVSGDVRSEKYAKNL